MIDYELLEEYLSKTLLLSKVNVRHVNQTTVNPIVFTYTHEYNEGNDLKGEVTIIELINFLYNKTK